MMASPGVWEIMLRNKREDEARKKGTKPAERAVPSWPWLGVGATCFSLLWGRAREPIQGGKLKKMGQGK